MKYIVILGYDKLMQKEFCVIMCNDSNGEIMCNMYKSDVRYQHIVISKINEIKIIV